MKKLLPPILLFICFCILSCEDNSLYGRLERHLGKDVQDSAIVRFVDIFPMSWDTLFVLEPYIYHRPKYQRDQEFERRIILVRNGVTLFLESEASVEDNYSIIIDSERFYYIPETAIFSVIKRKGRRNNYFLLTPIITDTLYNIKKQE